MSSPVKRKVKIVGAKYSHEAKSILLSVQGEAEKEKFYAQIVISELLPNITNIDSFTEDQMKKATSVFCKSIVGQVRDIVFDPELNNKIKDHYPLKY